MSSPLERLLTQLRGYVAGDANIAAFVGEALDGWTALSVKPMALPVCALLGQRVLPAAARTEALKGAILAAARDAHWQLSYNLADGFSQDYLDRSGWFNLAAPTGSGAHFGCASMRVAVGYWDRGLYYPRHRHAPEEIYLVVAGSARFRSQDGGERVVGPGGLVRHRAFEPHSAAMGDEGLLAVAFWRGRGLLDKSEILPEWGLLDPVGR